MSLRARAASAILVLGLALCGSEGEVLSADMVFTPPTLTLTARVRNASVVLTNRGQQPVRFEVRGLHWDQKTDGRMQLDPTDELLVFPALITIPPGQDRTIRVADSGPPSSLERSFRLEITEIPEFQPTPKLGASVNIRSQFMLPVFYAPIDSRVAGVVSGASLQHGKFSFAILNTGTVHFKLKGVDVIGLGSGGRKVFTHSLEGWYVLPGGERDYSIDLDGATCAATKAITVSADAGSRLVQTIEVPSDACRS
jgi:fimbrial chaperone protein